LAIVLIDVGFADTEAVVIVEGVKVSEAVP